MDGVDGQDHWLPIVKVLQVSLDHVRQASETIDAGSDARECSEQGAEGTQRLGALRPTVAIAPVRRLESLEWIQLGTVPGSKREGPP
jgi:hypothetical protein